MLTCKQTFLLEMASGFRQLSWRERMGMRMHLAFCCACRRFRQQMSFIRQAARRFPGEQAEADEQLRLSAESRDRIARNLDRHD
jgi:hypothetical protein